MAAQANEWEHLFGANVEPPYEAEPDEILADETSALDQANWHLRYIDRIRRQRVDLEELFATEIDRLTARLGERLVLFDAQEAWHAKPVEALHRAIVARDETRKTITLPSGTLRARAQQPEWRYGTGTGDEWVEETDTFLVWAQANAPHLVRVPEPIPPTVDKSAVKKALVTKDVAGRPVLLGVDPESGERPPGLAVVSRELKVTIDTDGGETE